ncbi:MAG: DNA-binding domain-containing protein [Proteobacteria bacterium]|nr:DNA-binding domain-containing protein [Pseudomonadota bacterium]
MNTGLAELQRLFQDRLLAGGNDIERHLKDRGPFLKVYDHAYLARLLEVMGEDFPAVHTLLGDDQFGDAAVAFVRAHPSRARSIRWLGAGFSAWLREADPWRNLPVVADMAAFEWALGLAFDAPDSEPVGMPALAAVPAEAWPGLRFEFHRSLNIVRLAVDVAPFQRAVAAERDPEAAPEPLSEPGDCGGFGATWKACRCAIGRYRWMRRRGSIA